MTRKATTLILVFGCAAALLLPSTALAAFGFQPGETAVTFTDAKGNPSLQAGSHPFATTTTLKMNTALLPEGGICKAEFCELPEGEVEGLETDLPAGFTGNPFATPRCSNADFINRVNSQPSCPDSTAVGISAVKIEFDPVPLEEINYFHVPVYNLTPPPGVAAKLGFAVLSVPVTIDFTINPSPPYNVEAHVSKIAQAVHFYSSALTIWGNPASPVHNAFRGHCLDPIAGTPIDEPKSVGNCPAQATERAFVTLPRRCEGPLETVFHAVAWNSGDTAVETVSTQGEPLGCDKLGFAPELSTEPTSHTAESPTGFDFDLNVNDPGLLSPTGFADSDIKKAVVTLPKGVTVNPSQAEGLATCSQEGFEREKAASAFGAGCPAASKIGTVEVETPILEGKILRGSAFVATPYHNSLGTLIALYVTIKEPELGINIGLAGKVEPNSRTGQLVTTFDNLPQQPLSHFHFHFREGARSSLVSPPLCGTYTTRALFTPWANPSAPYPSNSSFEVTAGPGGAACPSGGAPPFHPDFEAGSLNNAAGAYSPFLVRLSRADGEQDMTSFSAVLPRGLLAKVAGVSKCSDAGITTAKAKSGSEEIASPSCPSSSLLGTTMAGAGVGTSLTYVPGKLYLAGPFGGDPLSVVSITPAVAGPFDVGTVVVREALVLNPETAEAEVDGAHSDPIPHILAGIPLKLRELRVDVGRPSFMLNPTSCAPTQTRATIFGDFLDVIDPVDDVPFSTSSRYQTSSCASLAFKPKLAFALKGGTRRNDHPALVATLSPRPGDANIGPAVATLPASEFIDNAHIQSPCTRVQFAAGHCPPGSVLGTARAVTPLLDEPLEGPVYFRSNGGERQLPDVVVDLHGLFQIVLVGFVDSRNGRIRTTFATPPDAPVTSFTLELRGGRKGLLVNSRNLCTHRLKVDTKLTGQNGRLYQARMPISVNCGTKKTKHRR